MSLNVKMYLAKDNAHLRTNISCVIIAVWLQLTVGSAFG